VEACIRLFGDRREAGRVLANYVCSAVKQGEPLVLALPRGGVPVGAEVAEALHAPLDVFVVRKLGTPDQEELGFGAVATGGTRILNRELIDYLHLSDEVIQRVTEREQKEVERREQLYRQGRTPIAVEGRTLVLVDDGLATGASMLAAVRALRAQGAGRIIVAVPVAARSTCDEFRKEGVDVICTATPHPFGAVGIWYEDFAEVSDEDVQKLLEAATLNWQCWSAGDKGRSRGPMGTAAGSE